MLQVELGMGKSNGGFVRVCIIVPVYRPLETKVAMNAGINDQLKRVEFNIKYQKFPWFCCLCGYLGHQEGSCG